MLFLLLFVGLFLMLVGASCAETGVEYMRTSDDVAEQVVTIPLAFAAAIVGAALATAAFSGVSIAVATGYRMLVGALPRAGGALGMVGVGAGTMLLSAALGGWRLHAGLSGGEPGWVMQGTVVAAVGVIAGFLLLVPYIVLAFRGGAKSGRSHKKEEDDDDAFPHEFTFTFFAVLGLVASYAVVEYVHIARAQAGEGPLPVGEFVDGWVRTDGFHGYPEEATLALPRKLEGKHAIIFIEVDPCQMKLVNGDGDAVRTKRIAAKKDDDGDTETYARLVFDADEDERYRLVLTTTDQSCLYSVRLVKERSK